MEKKNPIIKPWYKGKVKELALEVLKGVFSISFFKAIIISFFYFIHEHVTWRRELINRGKYVRIHPKTSIRHASNIVMGDNVRITMNCCIWAEKNSKIVFGSNVLVGPGVKMFCGNHGTELNGIPMSYQDRKEKNIFIGNDVWIGANSIITSGVSIADGTVVAAGSVVTKSILNTNTVVAGIPAKQIFVRK